MIDIGTILRHYKRPEIQEAMLNTAQSREVAVRYGDKGFGKRPDELRYGRDVLEFAKNYATSFHVSEERWSNVFQLGPGMKPKNLDNLRIGWDLVLDIDCPVWEYSKLITHHLIKALQKHGIKSISCKFSGNKGFHIGVPFEAFPKVVGGEETRLWFPNKIKKILLYLADYLDSKENNFLFTNDLLKLNTIEEICVKLGESKETLFLKSCNNNDCGEKYSDKKIDDSKNNNKENNEIFCPSCLTKIEDVNNEKFIVCKKCNHILTSDEINSKKSSNEIKSGCPKCKSKDSKIIANPETLLGLDTMLITSRHMYRLVYSLHEKAGLSSIPVDIENVLNFQKEMANPDKLTTEQINKIKFLDTSNSMEDETLELFENALSYDFEEKEIKERENAFKDIKSVEKKQIDYEEIQDEIPIDLFPPCIHNILKGLRDGKKRSMFAMINFLSNVGYSYDTIDEILMKWNKKNPEPLREVIIKGQIRYRKTQKIKILPANCDNKMYYKDLQVCTPDNFCRRIKNPVNYALLKAKILGGKGKGRKKLTDEQKEMRKKFRDKKKIEKEKLKKDNEKIKNKLMNEEDVMNEKEERKEKGEVKKININKQIKT